MSNKNKINTYYSKIGRKEEFFTKIENKEELTNQSQLAGASIKEMAKKFGIDAIMSKAQQMTIENQKLLDSLYGHDYTNLFKSKEELLNVKKKLNTEFEKIPAKLRKTLFGDDITEFVHAMTTNDENRLKQLNKHGIISDKQLNNVITYNKEIADKKKEAQTQERFIAEFEKMKGGLYENFKKTGNININDIKDNTTNNQNVQTDIQ